jgi:nucleoside 2-deoxyribosyltransferase
MKIYLAHSHKIRDLGKDYESLLMRWGYEVINPFDGDEESRTLTKLYQKHKYAKSQGERITLKLICKMIYEKDLRRISMADALVVLYALESTGTSQEIQIGEKMRKPVIIVTDFIHPFTVGLGNATILESVYNIREVEPRLRATLGIWEERIY